MTRHTIRIVLVLLAVYGFVEAWPLIAGPTISIFSPIDNASFPNGIVSVQGVVKRAAIARLNGSALLHDQNGRFSSTLTFPLGGSILTFTVIDRFGRTVTATRSIFVPSEN